MLEKIKEIKFEIGKNNKPLVLILENNCGLIKNIIPYYNGKYDFMIGWNVYSVVRHVFNTFAVNCVYRKKDGEWIKLNVEKIKQLSEIPLNTAVSVY